MLPSEIVPAVPPDGAGVKMVRLAIGGAVAMLGLGFARVGTWVVGVEFVDPTVQALEDLRGKVQTIPTYDLDYPSCIQRSVVLAAIGEAITEAEQ